ncbi:hypothetical protein P7K49_029563 [Saguinus oedipus]|uniref:Uncharacterized protein n=1 Tax=Saguinus oedipus TaxID=9490 RepID=A0ABQ9U7J1_SAGOE|nr:hypothetical protein P7K49_029563 [Saguinus oedipus]
MRLRPQDPPAPGCLNRNPKHRLTGEQPGQAYLARAGKERGRPGAAGAESSRGLHTAAETESATPRSPSGVGGPPERPYPWPVVAHIVATSFPAQVSYRQGPPPPYLAQPQTTGPESICLPDWNVQDLVESGKYDSGPSPVMPLPCLGNTLSLKKLEESHSQDMLMDRKTNEHCGMVSKQPFPDLEAETK